MKHGFIRVAAATPDVKVADPQFNRTEICALIRAGIVRKAKLMVFPELSLTAYTCGDLFGQDALLSGARRELKEILKETEGSDLLAFIGMPWERGGKLYNAAVAVQNGRILGVVPKTNLPNYAEFYERRYFEPGNEIPVMVSWEGQRFPMGTNILFACEEMPGLIVAAEICEDAWVPCPPSIRHTAAGATVIVNCSASDETTGKDIYRRSLITGHSASLVCGYVYANAGDGESTQDLVFGGQNLITENGTCLAESKRFANDTIFADLDLERLNNERRRLSTYPVRDDSAYFTVGFHITEEEYDLERPIDPMPFVPTDEGQRNRRCEEILSIQAMGLKKRLSHTGCSHAVLGISGVLHSILVLIDLRLGVLDPESHRERLRFHKDLHPIKLREQVSRTVSYGQDHMICLNHSAICSHHAGDSSILFQNFRDFRPEMHLSAAGDDPVSYIFNHTPQHICSDMWGMVVKDRRIGSHLHKRGENFPVSSRGILYQCI